MFIVRKYTCDFGHSWSIRRRSGEEERASDALCPEEHEAVTCQEEVPADVVRVIICPAARAAHPPHGLVVERDRHWLVLQDHEGSILAESEKSYTWDEVARLAGRFGGKSPSEAMKWWLRKPP